MEWNRSFGHKAPELSQGKPLRRPWNWCDMSTCEVFGDDRLVKYSRVSADPCLAENLVGDVVVRVLQSVKRQLIPVPTLLFRLLTLSISSYYLYYSRRWPQTLQGTKIPRPTSGWVPGQGLRALLGRGTGGGSLLLKAVLAGGVREVLDEEGPQARKLVLGGLGCAVPSTPIPLPPTPPALLLKK